MVNLLSWINRWGMAPMDTCCATVLQNAMIAIMETGISPYFSRYRAKPALDVWSAALPCSGMLALPSVVTGQSGDT
jgi:hypothetical protein